MYQALFSNRISGMSGNAIREILKVTQQPDFISFAGGIPGSDCFPLKEIKEIANEISCRTELLQYGTSEGYQPLREWISEWIKTKGIQAKPSEIVITTGSQQGIDLSAKAFLNPGESILVENPTYLAAIQIFTVYEAQFSVIETDENGLIPSSLKNEAQKKAHKLIYTIPNFQNPTGITLSLERRQEVAKMLKELNLILIEDDPYGDVCFNGNSLKPIKAFDKDDRVIYLGSFSKIISPGLRVGFAVAHEDIIRKLTIGKQTTDVHTCNMAQGLVYEFCRRGLLEPHIKIIRQKYKEKRDLMIQLLEDNFPPEVTWTMPEGGLFIWVKMPSNISTIDLLKEAVKEKIAFIPGDTFFALGGVYNTMRLNFSNATNEKMEEGITKLGQVVKKYLSQNS